MVDEIDLLLHPKWQMKVIPTVARALPRMQFVFTSHSPLVASSLEWMNIILLRLNPSKNRTSTRQLRESIHGLDADQVLISDFFGLSTTRARKRSRQGWISSPRKQDSATKTPLSRLSPSLPAARRRFDGEVHDHGDGAARIDKEAPGWLSKVQRLSTTATAVGASRKFPNLWSEIKQVYITLQESKCAFCEKWLEDDNIEHDVEHFRPKGRVDRWPVPSTLRKVGRHRSTRRPRKPPRICRVGLPSAQLRNCVQEMQQQAKSVGKK